MDKSKIIFNTIVELQGNVYRHIKVEVEESFAVVYLETRGSSDLDRATMTINWHEFTDVELLSRLFGMERVCVFKELVALLGRVYNQQQALKEFM